MKENSSSEGDRSTGGINITMMEEMVAQLPEDPQKGVGEGDTIHMANICEGAHHLQRRVQNELLQRGVLFLRHDQIMQIAYPQPQRAPFPHRRHARQAVPIFILKTRSRPLAHINVPIQCGAISQLYATSMLPLLRL